MNSLNLLSARVLGETAPIPTKSTRSRSISEGITKFGDSVTQPRRSVSQHARTDGFGEFDGKAILQVKSDDSEEDSQDDAVNENTPLINNDVLDVKPSRHRLHTVVKRLANAIAESLRWVLSKLASPGIYVVTCFYSDDGQFSPLVPIHRVRRKLPKRNGNSSTAHAMGLSGSSDSTGLELHAGIEKRLMQSNSQPVSEKRLSMDTISTSESDVDRERKESVHSRDGRLKAQSTALPDEITPTRRSIRIKLRREDPKESTRRKRPRKTADTSSISVDDAPDAVTAANVKSPTSPPSSLRLTRYPRSPAPPRPLIPRRQPSYSSLASHYPSATLPQKTLVIDLDETLIHSMAKGGRMSSGHMVEVKLSHPASYNGLSLGSQHPILYYVHKRPHCDDFLKKVCKWYNLVVFTASVQEYADPVIDWLEQERKYFSARYYRQHCTFRNGAYIKDLSSVEPDLSSVMILDNSPLSYIFHEGSLLVQIK